MICSCLLYSHTPALCSDLSIRFLGLLALFYTKTNQNIFDLYLKADGDLFSVSISCEFVSFLSCHFMFRPKSDRIYLFLVKAYPAVNSILLGFKLLI